MRFAWRGARTDIVNTPLRHDAFTLNSSISSTARNLVSLAGYSAARHAKRRYGVLPYGRQSEPKADRLSEVRTGAVGPACPPDPTPRVCNIRRALLDSPLEGTGLNHRSHSCERSLGSCRRET